MPTNQQSENRISAARGPPLRPIYRRLGVSWEDGQCRAAWFQIEGLLLLRRRRGANGLRGPQLLIHPIELRLQLNQFAKFLRRWQLRGRSRGTVRCDLGRAAAAGR